MGMLIADIYPPCDTPGGALFLKSAALEEKRLFYPLRVSTGTCKLNYKRHWTGERVRELC